MTPDIVSWDVFLGFQPHNFLPKHSLKLPNSGTEPASVSPARESSSSSPRRQLIISGPSQKTATTLPSQPLSSSLKLHHPDHNHDPSAFLPTTLKFSTDKKKQSTQTHLFVRSLYNIRCPHSLHRMGSPCFSSTFWLQSPQMYCVVKPGATSSWVAVKADVGGA